MESIKKLIIKLIIVVFFLCQLACSDFLDKKVSMNLTTPSSLKDLQAVLDNNQVLNRGAAPSIIEGRTDDFFIGKGGYDRLREDYKDIYIFKERGYYTSVYENWRDPYAAISLANTVLDEMKRDLPSKGVNADYLKGTALFHRALAHFYLVQVYSEVYDPLKDANTISGIPYKTSSDAMIKTVRNTLQETYDLIEKDLLESVSLLPTYVEFLTRPSKAAGFAALARFYLSKSDFERAEHYSNLVLNTNNELMDFNELDKLSPTPFPIMNKEILFFSEGAISFLHPNRECYVDTLLFKSYSEDDLRKQVFFRPENNELVSFKGSFLGYTSGSYFVGFSISEMYLIRAECNARKGDVAEALKSLNHLLMHRWSYGNFSEVKETDSELLLDFILLERRKELIMRGVRWTDMKRLNLEERYRKDVIRRVYGEDKTYVLKPNSSEYIYQIPNEVIDMTKIEQN